MTYTLIDIGAESIVLLVTLSVQYYLDPRDSGFRILAGIQKVHFISMTTILLVAWMTTLGYMCVYSGFGYSFCKKSCGLNASLKTRHGLVVSNGVVNSKTAQ